MKTVDIQTLVTKLFLGQVCATVLERVTVTAALESESATGDVTDLVHDALSTTIDETREAL